MKRQYHIIGALSCWGAPICACDKGPEILQQSHTIDRLKKHGADITGIEMLRSEYGNKNTDRPPIELALKVLKAFNSALAIAVHRAVQDKKFPIVIGGDHSVAVGTWNGQEPSFGLIWIDAHMDAHTPETTPSNACHGMPLAALLGFGAPEMARLLHKEPIIKPQNLALIGIRSFEPEEEALLKRLGVRMYFMDEVRRRGLQEILPEAIEHVAKGPKRFGISLDLDVFSPEATPGVNTPEKDGIAPQDLLPLLGAIRHDPRLIGLEIVEYNPMRDVDHKTRDLCYDILQEVTRP